MTAVVLRGDAAHLPLPDASVDLIVTSPPYWKLRDYRDGGERYDGQIGSEETPQLYLEALWRCTAITDRDCRAVRAAHCACAGHGDSSGDSSSKCQRLPVAVFSLAAGVRNAAGSCWKLDTKNS